jgi:hypothetical protein
VGPRFEDGEDGEDQLDRSFEKSRIVTWRQRGEKSRGIGNILLRNCFLKHVMKGNVEGRMEVKGRRSKQLLDELKETRGYR